MIASCYVVLWCATAIPDDSILDSTAQDALVAVGGGGEATSGTFDVSPLTVLSVGSAMTQPRTWPFWINHHVFAALRPMICAVSPFFIAAMIAKAVLSPARVFRLSVGEWTVNTGSEAGGAGALGAVSIPTR